MSEQPFGNAEQNNPGQSGTPNMESGAAPGAGSDAQSNYQRMADVASKQMTDGVDALRRGEFIRNAITDPSADSDDRLVALLAYIVPVLLPMIIMLSESSKKRPFQRYHAVQSLGLTGLMLLLTVAITIVTGILGVVPIIGFLVAMLMLCLSPLFFLMAVVAVFYYGYQAYQGRRFAIPIVTGFMSDQGWL